MTSTAWTSCIFSDLSRPDDCSLCIPIGLKDGSIGLEVVGLWVASPRSEELKVVEGEESAAPAAGQVPCFEDVVVATG